MEFSNLMWTVPFLGIIFSMSFIPLLFSKFWHKYGGLIPAFWGIIYIFSIAYVFGINEIFNAIFEPIFDHYIPFIILISSLYIVSGGIFIDFPRGEGAFFNTCFLFFGSLISGLIGTTGSATLLIRPLLRSNTNRQYKTHLVVFFIFLIANIGGISTPLGDPPLFIGFLEGVDFFWFIKNLYGYQLITTILLCLLFFVIDFYLLKRENYSKINKNNKEEHVIFRGKRNFLLIIGILTTVVLCNFDGSFILLGESFSYSPLLRNVILLSIAVVSMRITPHTIRERNSFSFEPIKEIVNLFACIFITVTPIISMLHQGTDGSLKFIFDWIAPNNTIIAARCFWASGLLSSILDNAPTFLIFFHMLSGNAVELMTVKADLLAAISISTVFMGAITYIGNAPNLMVKSIAGNYGVKVPSFIGYMVWSIGILIPVFFIISHFL